MDLTKGYSQIAKQVFDKSGRQIINAMLNSKLNEDVFPKMDFVNIQKSTDKTTGVQ